jgi:hypothetical protein
MVKIRESASGDPKEYALSLPPNPNACNDYGGCPFRSVCNLSPHELICSVEPNQGKDMTISTVDLFAKLRQRQAAKAGVAPVVVEAPTESTLLEKLATEPALGINPPEKDLPIPPVEVAQPVAPKKGRPAGSKNKPKETTTPTEPPPADAFTAAGLDVTPAPDAETATEPVSVASLTVNVFDYSRIARAVVDELVSRLKGAA